MSEHEVYLKLYGESLFKSVPHYMDQVRERYQAVSRVKQDDPSK